MVFLLRLVRLLRTERTYVLRAREQDGQTIALTQPNVKDSQAARLAPSWL
jgi:hypothetical protein